MGKDSPSPPAAPDPAKTAAAQTATNKETAYWNAVLNNVNQITPYGNLTYSQTGGGKKYNDAGYQAALQGYNAQLQAQAQANQAAQKNGNRNMSSVSRAIKNAPVAPKYSDFLISDAPPTFTSEINLSPEQQQLYDTKSRSDNALASLGESQIGRISQSVSTPFSFSGLPDAFSNEDATLASQRGEEALMSRLNPQFERDDEALRTRLANQGIMPGSEAYRREMESFGQNKNDARMQAILQGANYGGTLQSQALQRRNQGINEYTTERNAPLNEYIGLTSGTQVQNPQFQSTGYQGAAPVDYAGLVNQQYQGNLNNYNQQVAGNNSTQGALFGLGGQALGGFLGSNAGSAMLAGFLSDERAKENMVPIGKTPGGITVYEFNYKGGEEIHTGVMAQEVEKVIPDAVYTGEDGYKRVIYGMVR